MSEILFARLDELNAASASLQTQINTIIGGGTFTNAVFTGGIVINPASSPSTNAILVNDNVSPIGLSLGTAGTGNNVNSQSIRFKGRTSGAVNRVADIHGDVNGALVLTPDVASGLTAVQDGSGLSILLLSSGFSNVHMNIPGLSTAGVITNSSAGSLISTTNLSTTLGGLGANNSASSGVPLFAAGVVTMVSTSGSGNFARVTSPTFVTPDLGTPSAVILTNATGTAASLVVGTALNAVSVAVGNISGTASGILTFLTTSTSANLKAAVTDETGSGSLVFATSPSLVTPNFSSIVNTGTLTLPTSTDTLVGKATTDTFTNKTYDTAGTGNSFQINSVAVTANTGTGAVARATSPTFVTPTLGAAIATTINGAALDNLAWTSYTPTVTSQGGTPTTVTPTGRYKQIGKTVLVGVQIVVNAAGTATGFMAVSLPVTASASALSGGSSYESATTGNGGITALITGVSTSTFRITNISAITYWVTGYIVQANITYEAA